MMIRRELVDEQDPHDLRREWPCRSFGFPPGAWWSNPAVPTLLHREGNAQMGGDGFCSEQLKLWWVGDGNAITQGGLMKEAPFGSIFWAYEGGSAAVECKSDEVFEAFANNLALSWKLKCDLAIGSIWNEEKWKTKWRIFLRLFLLGARLAIKDILHGVPSGITVVLKHNFLIIPKLNFYLQFYFVI